MAVETFISGGGSSASPTSLTYQPGGPGGKGIYTDWPSLYSAAHAIHPSLVSVALDPTYGTCTVTGPGPYALDNMEFWVPVQFLGAMLEIADGVVCSSLPYVLACPMLNRGSTAPFQVTTTAKLNVIFNGGAWSAEGAAPIIDAQVGSWLLLHMESSTVGYAIPGLFSRSLQITGGVLAVVMRGQSSMGPVCIDSDPAGLCFCVVATNVQQPGYPIYFDQSVHNPAGFLGVWAPSVPNTSADLMDYPPGNLANWSGVRPNTLTEALDRIAAHVGPIP